MTERKMIPTFVLLVLALAKLAFTDTAAQFILDESDKDCADPNGTVTLMCRAYFSAKAQEPLHWYRRYSDPKNDTRWFPIDVANSPDKYEEVVYTKGPAKGLDLEVRQVTASDAGVYGCGISEQNIAKESRLTVLDHSDFRLSSTGETLKLGQNLTVKATAGCKLQWTLRVVKKDSSGTGTAVGHGPQGQDMEPYVTKNGYLVIPKFRCEDAGDYEFTHTTSAEDDIVPVDTKKTVYIRGEDCSTPVPIQPTRPIPSPGKDKRSKAPVEEKKSVNAAVPVLAVFVAILIVVVLILSFVVLKQRRENRTPTPREQFEMVVLEE